MISCENNYLKRALTKPCLWWGLLGVLTPLFSPWLIILFPSASILILSIFLLLTAIFMFFLHIQRHLKADGWRDNKKLTRSILAAITVIFIINAELTIIREHILAGYKAVSNQLQPSLVDGDHYLGDKFLYKLNGPQRDDIFIIRDNNDNVLAGRLLKLPGEPVPDSSGRRILGEDEYGFATGNNQIIEVLHAHQIQARAIVIYGSYDPLLKAIIWNRTGMIVR